MHDTPAGAQLARQEIEMAQEAALVSRLAEARSRITELERNERRLSAEIDNFRTKLADALRPLQADFADHMIFAPARIDALITSLDIVQRRDLWLAVALEFGLPSKLEKLYPHDGGADQVRILVCGSGGYGDMLYLSMVIRGLYERFDAPRIFVIHEHKGIKSVFENNPYVVDAYAANPPTIRNILNAAATLDIFDLVADVRYAVAYCAPPKSRVPDLFLREASSKSIAWQKYCRDDWPFLNNMFAKEIVKLGFNQYSFVEYTANLDFKGRYYGDIFPSASLDAAVAGLLSQPYISVHHGSDKNMSSAGGLQTKNLTEEAWAQIVSRLKDGNFSVVQVGEEHEALIAGDIIDLRGKLGLDQTALVLKYAQAHLDTEGGLVHLARAVGTRSVVAFGPTPPAFFGYPGNANVAPAECGDCWWTTRKWATSCPREFALPPCMNSHDPSKLAKEAVTLARRVKTIEIIGRRAGSASFSRGLSTETAVAIATSLKGLDRIRDQARIDQRIYVAPELLSSLSERGPLFVPRPFFPVHIGEASDSADEVVAEVPGALGLEAVADLVGELARIVRPGGSVVLHFDNKAALTTAELVAAVAARPGGRIQMIAPQQVGALADQELVLLIGEGRLPASSAGARAIKRIFGPKSPA